MKTNCLSTLSLADQVRIALCKPAVQLRRGVALIGMSVSLLSTPPIMAVELPIACVSGACGNNTKTNTPITWITSGAASASSSGNTLTINQSTENATLNWQSFNISADGKVIFSQPSTTSIALNRIFQESPSTIFGSIKTQLNSDATKTGGQIYLVNPNGFVFGANSSVNAAGILVSTLGLSEDNFSKGLLTSRARTVPALGDDPDNLSTSFIQASHLYVQDMQGNDLWFDGNGNRVVAGAANATRLPVQIVVKPDAQLTAAAQGRILLASQSISNAGILSSPDGQVILAAGDRVYLAASADSSLRGLLVEVAAGGTAYNELTGNINADHGDVTIIGAAVNQDGRISAKTSVSENGSVHLLARYSDTAPVPNQDEKGNPIWVPSRTGTVTLGSNSAIDVSADLADTTTAVDDQVQLAPTVALVGKQIVMQGGANITAHGGNLTMQASDDPSNLLADDTDARIRIDSGAVIDLSGNDAVRSVADNIVNVELRGTELADSPDQRDGALRGQSVTVDARMGTAIADVSGAIGTIGKTVAERTSNGGVAIFNSTGDVVTAKDATINVSGGQTTFTGAMVNTSQLITADGNLVDIGSAKEDVTYVGVVSPTTQVKHDRWGVVEKITQQTGSHYEAGYVQGSDAGVVQFMAPSMILNGTLVGHASSGAYQRDATSAAQGGELIIGTAVSGSQLLDYRAPAVSLSLNSPNIVVADDSDLPVGNPLILSTDYLTSGGFTRTEIDSNGVVTFAADAPLILRAGSELSVLTPQQVNLNSSITAQAGKLDITGGVVNVADNIKLDVSGAWINDLELANNVRPVTTLYQNAGQIALLTNKGQNNALNIGSDTQFIANGGAWLQSTGVIAGGSGGAIALQSNSSNSSFAIGDNVGLQAYGVNGAAGGSFTLSAGRLQLVNGNHWTESQRYDPADPDSDFFKINSSLFSDHGFSSINLIASGGTTVTQGDALQVASDTHINAVVSTLQLSSQSGSRVSGGDVENFSAVTTLPDYQRNGAAIGLSVLPYDGFGGQTTLGTLNIQQGAQISGDVGTKISLSNSGGSIDIDGSLMARAGSIDVHINKPVAADTTPNDPDLQLLVGGDASLDVSGATLLTPSDSGLLQGSVKSGGVISLTADRGSLLIEPGARLNASGTAATLDISSGQSTNPYIRARVASNAGTISLQASESIGLFGTIQALAGIGDTGIAEGGTLSVTLTRANAAATGLQKDTFSQTDRVVELSNDALPFSGNTLNNGLASISVTQIRQAGIDDLELSADNQVVLDAGVNLALQRRVQIDAPVLKINSNVADSVVTISAPYVLLGSSLVDAAVPDPSGGTGMLNINAHDMIDVLGNSALQNIDVVNLSSDLDIRLRGTGSDLAGSLHLDGDLALQAQRVFAATATQFSITADNTVNANTGDVVEHTVSIKQNGESPGVPLSAASAIEINAANIKQNGTLLAPFGTITLNATNALSLGAGSITSVSGDGALIPYGFTDANGKNWYYQTANTPVTDVPIRAVSLKANSIDIDAAATIDVSGGGDLYAYEWIKGTGGTNDAFGFKSDNNTLLTNPGLFAIIPALGNQVAPYDAQEAAVSAAQGLHAGDSVYLSSGSSLSAGFYTLLPARYALLPGAYLVTAVSGFNSIQPGMVNSLADGTPVVAGYRSFSDTGMGGALYSGFAVYPGSWGAQLAEYQISNASTFFTTAIHKTVDAGQLSINTADELIAQGSVNAKAAPGGQAATIDVSASNLQIVGNIGASLTGVVQLQDSVLNDWQAGRLLLGGSHSADDSTITIAATTVTVESNAHLQADEVVLVASDQVAINAGGSVQSTAAANNKVVTLPQATTLTLTGTGADKAAVVAVSDIDNIKLARDPDASSSSQGIVNIATGAHLATPGELIVDAPGGASLDGAFNGNGAQWTLASSHIVLGDSDSAGQLTINAALLNNLQTASALNLFSSGSIDFTHYENATNGMVSIGNATSTNEITLRASMIDNLSNDSLGLQANTVSFSGIESSAPATSAGTGTFSVDAQSINIAGGALTVKGFAQTTLHGAQVRMFDNGAMAVGGNLNVSADNIGAAAATNGMLSATDNVQLSSLDAAGTLPAFALGGGITIQGNNISDNVAIVAPSGVVVLDASNQLSLGDAAVINVAGVPVYAAGVRADSSGGTIKLSAGNTIQASASSVLNVAGSGNSNAGTLDINADGSLSLQSTLNAHAASTATGGAIVVNAYQVENFAALNDSLQTAGFNQQQSFHVQQGDLTLSSGKQVTAHDVQWVTDAGAIKIDGAITAPSTADRSSIRLYGADGVTVDAAGVLNADASATTDRGGIIEVGVGTTDIASHAAARVDLNAASVITADGIEQGRLLVRAPVINGNDVAVNALPANISKLGSVTIEAVLPDYSITTFANAYNDATNYIDNSNAGIQSRLNPGSSNKVSLTPGIELTSDGDLNLSALDLLTWRFNGTTTTATTPAALTFRAQGAVNVNGTISDGFATTGSTTKKYTYATDDASATLRFIAGSNLDSADPLATTVVNTDLLTTSMTNADLTLGAGVTVRTGTGDLSLVAAHDVVFGGKTPGNANTTAGIDQYSRAYTGGINAIGLDADDTLDTPLGKSNSGRTSSFLDGGGQLLIQAGNDVVGHALVDSVTAWQPRTGCVTSCGSFNANQKLTSWGIDIRQFLWNAGTLGGGDVTINATHDIDQLSVAAADSAIENTDQLAMTYYGGGSLNVTAGNNINSGMFYVGNNTAVINAGNAVATSAAWQDSSGNSLGLLLATDNAQININARASVQLAQVINSTALIQVTGAGDTAASLSGKQSTYYSYGTTSSLSVTSVGGDIDYQGTSQGFFGRLFSGGTELPVSVSLVSLSGDIGGSWGAMYSSSTGELSLFADNNISNFDLSMRDLADSDLRTTFNPNFATGATVGSVGLPSARHVGDLVPVSIVAGNDITGFSVTVPKAVQINVAHDMFGASITAQNVNADDVSEIIVGGDLDLSAGSVSVGGPGRLDILAGHTIDLGAGEGIVTTGNLKDANLPDADGASLTVMAGMAAGWNANQFIDDIVVQSITGANDLIAFVQTETGDVDLTLAQATTIFKALSATTQRPFILKQFFTELVASGQEANTEPGKGFSRGYAAIDALLPDDRSTDNPYSGDLSMLYSQIYTLSGGDINVLVPGGDLNVGVASRPLFVTNDKPAGQLGIVAQKSGSVNIFTNNDVLVNSSRIFTLLGGDIAIWSTLGNIDAGKGAKSSLSIPPPSISYDAAGNAIVNLSGAVAGSGIRTIQTEPGENPGNVDLIAPVGFVNAGDAGIGAAGNINIAARQVIGAENINFGGNATGVPAATSGVAVALSGAAAVGGSNDKSVGKSMDDNARDAAQQKAPIAQAALSWLEVFVVGLGEENCKQDDMECLKRQK